MSDPTASPIRTLGVIGAGQMGSGIAQVAAAAGHRVVLYDVSLELARVGIEKIARQLDRQVANGKLEAGAREATLQRIEAADGVGALAAADLVIEAATEREEVKRRIFAQVCPILRPDAILATNTSSISITRLASGTDRPERFLGIHFMNPVPVMKLVELVRGIATGDEAFAIAKGFAGSLGKTLTVSEDFPGFIVNRVLVPMINEAIYTLHEGVGTIESIDASMRLGANHPMGPFQLADFIGLDTCLAIMQVLHDGLADTKYRPCPLLVRYVEAGWLGKKVGRGFYDYRADPPRPTR